jgi:alkyl hydroperoxide reductase subunit AhpF
MNRRDFLKNSGIIAAAATLSPVMTACGNEASDLAGMKNIPDAYETDLLVVGGGPAGSCAAVAAALALKGGISPRGLGAEDLRTELKKQNAFL